MTHHFLFVVFVVLFGLTLGVPVEDSGNAEALTPPVTEQSGSLSENSGVLVQAESKGAPEVSTETSEDSRWTTWTTTSNATLTAVRVAGNFSEAANNFTCDGVSEQSGLRACQEFCGRTDVSFEMAMGVDCSRKTEEQCAAVTTTSVADYCCSCQVDGCVVGSLENGDQRSTCTQVTGECVFCGFRNSQHRIGPSVGLLLFSVVMLAVRTWI